MKFFALSVVSLSLVAAALTTMPAHRHITPYEAGFTPHLVDTLAVRLSGAEHYVSPDGGTRTGDGTIDHPWSLQYALDGAEGGIQPGDVIWLRGGVYSSHFVNQVSGSSSSPIIFRQYPGERATLQSPVIANRSGAGSEALVVRGSDVWFWGFDVMSDIPNASTAECGDVVDGLRGSGITVWGARTRLINLTVHDAYMGIAHWQTASSSEVYGNIIYFNGMEVACTHTGSTHGIYASGTVDHTPKSLQENISFWNASQNIRLVGWAQNASMIGNISFMAGRNMPAPWGERNFWFGDGGGASDAPEPVHNLVADANSSYLDSLTGNYNEGFNLGGYSSSAAAGDATFTNNYIAGASGEALVFGYKNDVRVACKGNTVWGPTRDYVRGQCAAADDNVFTGKSKPTKTFVRLRRNKYETGRANIAIFNWEMLPAVSVDLSGSGLVEGQTFTIRDAENFFGSPVASGTYAAGSPNVSIPMTGLTIAAPVATNYSTMPWHTAPEFGAFVVIPDPR